VDSGKLPGAISVVARRGKVVHFETYGCMDVEANKHMRPDTIFRLASMTKPIASVALMTQYEEGAFQLDDPVSQYIPAHRLKDQQRVVRPCLDCKQTKPLAQFNARDGLPFAHERAAGSPPKLQCAVSHSVRT